MPSAIACKGHIGAIRATATFQLMSSAVHRHLERMPIAASIRTTRTNIIADKAVEHAAGVGSPDSRIRTKTLRAALPAMASVDLSDGMVAPE